MLQFLCAFFLFFSFQGEIYGGLSIQDSWNPSFKQENREYLSTHPFLKQKRVLTKQLQNLSSLLLTKVYSFGNQDAFQKNKLHKILINAPSRAGPLV